MLILKIVGALACFAIAVVFNHVALDVVKRLDVTKHVIIRVAGGIVALSFAYCSVLLAFAGGSILSGSKLWGLVAFLVDVVYMGALAYRHSRQLKKASA